jgi:hypothetical protein
MSDRVEEACPIQAPPLSSTQPPPPPPPPIKDSADFARLHGPTNKTIETLLKKLSGPLVELLSHDVSLKLPDWDPAPGLLHKLNPVDLPPHRLRVKLGCIVTLLRDLNTSSQLSRSHHLRILRADNDRLECLVLDGQLQGTKALLTRVPFTAKYRNDHLHPFQRTQFPVRVSTDFTSSSVSRDATSSDFKLPTMPRHKSVSSLSKRPSSSVHTARPPANKNPTFKLPGLSASRRPISKPLQQLPKRESASLIAEPLMDGWDDFLDSGTQIARELSADTPPASPLIQATMFAPTPSIVDKLPPLSTQDLDFSMDDLDESPVSKPPNLLITKPCRVLARSTSLSSLSSPVQPSERHTALAQTSHVSACSLPPLRQCGTDKKSSMLPPKTNRRFHQIGRASLSFDLATLTPSQRPPSVSDRPGLKRKVDTALSKGQPPLTKRPCQQAGLPAAASLSLVDHNIASFLEAVGISSQEIDSFFADDEELNFGSPPIAV